MVRVVSAAIYVLAQPDVARRAVSSDLPDSVKLALLINHASDLKEYFEALGLNEELSKAVETHDSEQHDVPYKINTVAAALNALRSAALAIIG